MQRAWSVIQGNMITQSDKQLSLFTFLDKLMLNQMVKVKNVLKATKK